MPSPTSATPTVPESPDTIALQMGQLASGLRRVVMVPRGTQAPKRPKGNDSVTDAHGNLYLFDPKRIRAIDILKAAESDQLSSILGAADGGLGAPDKKDLGPEPVAVVARDAKGTEVQAAAVDPEDVHKAAAQADKLVPPGGDVTTEPVDSVIEGREDEDEPKHEFSSTQVDIPNPVADRIRSAGKDIPSGDLGEEGLEPEVHVTVKYGLHTEDPGDVARVVSGTGPVSIKLGKTSLFSNDDADVLKLDVESSDLHKLNKLISDSLETTDSHPKYIPHVTIAYLKPGAGKKYDGFDIPGVTGQVVVASSLVFSGKDGNKTPVALKSPTIGKPKLALKVKKAKNPKPPKSMAEIRAQSMIPYSSSKHSAMSGIQRLVQQGKFHDGMKAAERALASGKLTHDEIEHAVDRGLDSPLVADAQRLNLEQLVGILSLASPEERKRILPTLGAKLDKELLTMMPVERKSILQYLVALKMLRPEDAVA